MEAVTYRFVLRALGPCESLHQHRLTLAIWGELEEHWDGWVIKMRRMCDDSGGLLMNIDLTGEGLGLPPDNAIYLDEIPRFLSLCS